MIVRETLFPGENRSSSSDVSEGEVEGGSLDERELADSKTIRQMQEAIETLKEKTRDHELQMKGVLIVP